MVLVQPAIVNLRMQNGEKKLVNVQIGFANLFPWKRCSVVLTKQTLFRFEVPRALARDLGSCCI